MLYLTLLTPILALPGLLLMDRVERWAAGDHPQAFRVPRSRPHGRQRLTRPLAQREQEQRAVVIGLPNAAESAPTQHRTRTDRDWCCDHEPPRRTATPPPRDGTCTS